MSAVTLIFPHQLYRHHPSVEDGRAVYLVEDHLYFRQYAFHKQKLLLHRASMQYYADLLRKAHHRVHYIESHDEEAELSTLFATLAKDGVTACHYADTTDYLLERRLHRFARRHEIRLIVSDNPNFIHGKADNGAYFAEHKYYLTDYYIHLRKKYDILLDKGAKPSGGKWTYDTENRKRLPKGIVIPALPDVKESAYITEAKQYVEKHFAENPGSLERISYPVTHHDAAAWLEVFLKERLQHFGEYQDAISGAQHWLWHAVITPMLNVGLLLPADVIEAAVEYATTHKVPVNSLEGFVRQVLGWREYVRAVYEAQGVQLRKANHLKHYRKIPASLYIGATGILPVDMTIEKLLSTGYSHHIERLMLLGNFMLLCEIDPDEVYKWFMELYIDSYDWVMVPNVYGMSQYAAGSLMSTKPYISGSNYILKMSNYPTGPWCEIWDALYWRFIDKHRDEFAKNPRMSMMVSLVSRMDKNTLAHHIAVAEKFLRQL